MAKIHIRGQGFLRLIFTFSLFHFIELLFRRFLACVCEAQLRLCVKICWGSFFIFNAVHSLGSVFDFYEHHFPLKSFFVLSEFPYACEFPYAAKLFQS